MKNRKLMMIALVLVAVLAVFAVLHLGGREQVAAQTVQLTAQGRIHEISLSDLSLEPVSGIRINGKGEQIPVEGEGISLPKLLEQYKVEADSSITVVSDDSYSAVVAAGEAENAHFLLEEGELRLIVFGDSDSKRSVSNVKKIAVD